MSKTRTIEYLAFLTVLILLSLIFTSPASAGEVRDQRDYCWAIKNLAHDAASARQEGIPYDKLVEAAMDNTVDGPFRVYLLDLVDRAYSTTIMEGADKQQIVLWFTQETEADCLEALSMIDERGGTPCSDCLPSSPLWSSTWTTATWSMPIETGKRPTR